MWCVRQPSPKVNGHVCGMDRLELANVEKVTVKSTPQLVVGKHVAVEGARPEHGDKVVHSQQEDQLAGDLGRHSSQETAKRDRQPKTDMETKYSPTYLGCSTSASWLHEYCLLVTAAVVVQTSIVWWTRSEGVWYCGCGCWGFWSNFGRVGP